MSFRQLQAAPLLIAKYEKYKQWLALEPAARQSAYAANTIEAERVSLNREPGYVISFNAPGSSAIYLKTRILADNQTGQGGGLAGVLRAAVLSRAITATTFAGLATPISMEVRKYRFAKCALTQKSVSTTQETSRITGASYKKPKSDTVSSPFGGLNASEEFATASIEIFGTSGITTFLATANFKNTIKFTPEG